MKNKILFSAIIAITTILLISELGQQAEAVDFTIPSQSPDNERFGNSVAIDGNNILIANVRSDGNYGEVYHYDATTGALIQTFQNPIRLSLTTTPFFGIGLSIDGDKVLIGANGDSNGETLRVNQRTGAAHLFDLPTGDLIKTYRHPTLDGGANVGNSVSLYGDIALIGYCGCVGSTASGEGGYFLFNATSTGELLQTTTGVDSFGWSVFINGENFVVGSPIENNVFVSTNLDGIESTCYKAVC